MRRSPKKSSALSVADFATEWLGRKAQRVRPSVAINYEAKLSLFILPRLGHIALEDLTREDIEGWVTWAETAKMKSGRAYTRATVTGWWRALVTLVKDAVAELGLPVDPTNRVRAPKPRQQGRREKGTLTADQLGSLLGELKRIAPERYAEVYILAYSGVRAGELYALSDEDVDEKRARILIRKSVWNGHLDSTKTDSPREVALTPGMLAVIREHRAFLEASFHRGRKGTLLFPAQTGGYRTGQTLRKPLARAAEAAGIEQVVTPQVLRRTVNTLLLLSGVDRIVIRSQLGHVSEQMTERYAGIGVDAKLDAVARMEARKRMVTATDVPL
ncbi:MAG: tyrosine-type recombinase/integrase [Myxococcales bacterium]|nr:tyrosine-type recombinase/integrase [Myxococcales bacterium]